MKEVLQTLTIVIPGDEVLTEEKLNKSIALLDKKARQKGMCSPDMTAQLTHKHLADIHSMEPKSLVSDSYIAMKTMSVQLLESKNTDSELSAVGWSV